MKKTITTMALALGLLTAGAQNVLVDFETFTLTANSAYSPTLSTPFQASSIIFDYKYDGYWSGGFAYTNINDSITAGYTNMYGVRAYKGFNGSSYYAVGQDRAKITLSAPQTTVNGLYITNTTYAYKSMAKGDAFAKKFGGPSGNDPDFFKVIIKGYKNGALKSDSVTVMLADFTFANNAQDYILDSWQFVNTGIIGEVDSLKFFMRSSDVSTNGINTPLYFAIDNFSTGPRLYTGIAQQRLPALSAQAYPNPFNSVVTLRRTSAAPVQAIVKDLNGKTVYEATLSETESQLDLGALSGGVYFLELRSDEQFSVKKIIKN